MVVVSSCIAGFTCRYDGKKGVGRLLEGRVPLCPEVLGGLKIPRDPAEILIEGGVKKVVTEKGNDVTREYVKGAYLALGLAFQFGCTEALFKNKSPSCGLGLIYDGSFSKSLIKGDGITSSIFLKHGFNVRSLPLDGDTSFA